MQEDQERESKRSFQGRNRSLTLPLFTMAIAALESLPLELWGLVLSLLPRREVLKLAMVHRIFLPLTEPHRLAHLTLCSFHPDLHERVTDILK